MEVSRPTAEMKNSIKISYVNATPDDARGIKSVQHKTWRATYPKIAEHISEEMIDKRFIDMDGLVENSRRIMEQQGSNINFLVAKDGDEVVGFVRAVKATSDAEMNELMAIYVLPKYQGFGVGSVLMKQSLYFLDAERESVFLNVVDGNDQAIQFYQGFGFEKDKFIERDPESITPMDEWKMIRPPQPIS
jgi:ribosomal protein S18 acetylase RimI-like enzyme